MDPYPKIRKQNPRKPSKISRNFLPPKIKRLLLGLVSYDVFPTDGLRWRGRFHNHVQNKSTKNKKSLLGLVSYVYSQEIHFSGVDANIMFLNKCCALRRARPPTYVRMIIIPDRPSLLYTSYFVRWEIKVGNNHRNRIRRANLVRTFDGSPFFAKSFHRS